MLTIVTEYCNSINIVYSKGVQATIFIMQLLDKKMRGFKLTDSQMELLLDSVEYASQNENLPLWEQSKINDFNAMKADVFEGYR